MEKIDKFIKNPYVLALVWLMVISALLHLLNLFFSLIRTKNIQEINYFNVICLSLNFPSLGKTMQNFYISIITEVLIYVIFLIIFKIYSMKYKKKI
jgi:hypothetical protein